MDGSSKILINLESLLALGGKLNETNDVASILNITLLSLMGKLKLFRGVVFLPDKTNEYFTPILTKGKQIIQEIKLFEINEICKISEKDSGNELLKAGYEICIPIIYRSELLALICLSGKLDSMEITDEEYYYISLVSNITANALNNTKNINLLLKEKNLVESRNQLLTTLFEVSRDFNVFLSEEKIIKTLSLNLLGQLMITKFAVIELDSEAEAGNKSGNASNSDNDKNNLPLNNKNFNILKNTLKETPPNNLLQELFSCSDTCFTEELSVSKEIKVWLIENDVRVVSPMVMKSTIKGFLLIGKSTVGKNFTEENLLFIKVIGNTTVLALENLNLIKKEVERQKLENELSIALEIQKRLLPKKNPDLHGFDIYGTTQPSKFVGGDYYDFIKLPNGNLLVAIADVSGKGMPASLLMANVQAALRVMAPLGLPLNELIFRLNNLVYQNTSADRFVTFFAGELNSVDRTFKYINAGHNPPILYKSNGDIELLTSGGIILGVIENTDNYKSGFVTISDNDIIILYTDGVTESVDCDNNEYGENKLLQVIDLNKNATSHTLIEQIMNDVLKHSKSQQQHDDITIVSVKAAKTN